MYLSSTSNQNYKKLVERTYYKYEKNHKPNTHKKNKV